MSDEISPFEKKLAEKRRQRAAAQPQEQQTERFSQDAPELDELNLDPLQAEIDAAIERMGIIEAYNRWCRKMHVGHTTKKESIKVRCPHPNHADKDPSAWLNTEKNVYHCGNCEQGGDVWDLAAYHFGFPVPGYKEKALFRQLREKIASDLGYSIVHGINETHVIRPGEGGEDGEDAEGSGDEEPAPVALLPSGAAEQAQIEAFINRPSPTIDWKSIVQENTFLHEWMLATTVDDCPEEFHFWTGLMAIGFACGRNVVLADNPEVVGNLFVCLVGPSGAGKSKAKRHLRNIVGDVLPYDESNPLSSGTRLIGRAGSGEYLVGSFSAPIQDPSDPKKILGFAPVRGLVDYEEFAGLVATGSRAGSTLKDNLMDIYDAQKYLAGGSLTNGRRTAQDPFGQAISTTQNASLGNLLTTKDDSAGFINRWVFASGKLKAVRSWGSVEVNLSRPSEFLRNMYAWANRSKKVEMEPDALEAWDQFFHGKLHPTKTNAEERGSAMLNRIDLLLKKIILLLCANALQITVSKDIVERAIKLFDYLTDSYGVVQKEIRRTEEVDHGDFIIEQIKRITDANGKAPTKREIYLATKHKFSSYDACSKLLSNLVKLELVIEEAFKPKTGRPSVRYAVSD